MFDKSKKEEISGSERVRKARSRAKNGSSISDINFKNLLILIVFLACLLFSLIFGIKYLVNFIRTAKSANSNETTYVDRLNRQVMIDEVDISGMTRQEAKSAVENTYPWTMKVHLGDDLQNNFALDNLLEIKLNRILDNVYSHEGNKSEHYDLEFDDMDNEISEEIKKTQKHWDKQPKNGSISGFNKSNKTFTYEDAEDGHLIDAYKLKEDLMSALDRKNFTADISVTQNDVKPSITAAEAKEKYKVIGTFTTKTTDNKDRNTNIALATEALDGLIIKPGEEFSFNNATGNRTTERGYKAAGAYVNGVLAEEPGGGVCQVSSTLYNAVIFAGLRTTERHAHSYEPTYVTPGEDAMVSYDGYAGPDMKFINTANTAIAIRAMLTGQTLTCSIIGMPILEDGMTIEMTSKKISDLKAPEPEYIEDKNIPEGRRVVISEAESGSKWSTDYIVKKDGVVIKEEAFHNSTYKGKPAKIKIHSRNKDTAETVSENSALSSETCESSSQENSLITQDNGSEENTDAEKEITSKESDKGAKAETTADTKTENSKGKETAESSKTKEKVDKLKETGEGLKSKETAAETTVEKLNTAEVGSETNDETVPTVPD